LSPTGLSEDSSQGEELSSEPFDAEGLSQKRLSVGSAQGETAAVTKDLDVSEASSGPAINGGQQREQQREAPTQARQVEICGAGA